ncbi:MAG TPA: YebC/PmpR family DNA-binding transcriptional regulator, partial [Promineifilum sp.]|nr:YebC/PmpR family DNA-binding transcriptional regulator [Promineifilum sp.]
PKDNIDRAIKRGTGELEGGELIEAVYEAYGPHGVGILVHVVTDNRNRAIADVRHAVSKHGGTMAEAGAVSWQFTRKGYISVSESVDPDELFMVAAEAGADDVQFNDGVAEIYSDVTAFQAVRVALEEAGVTPDEASLIYEPNNPVSLNTSGALQVMSLVERIEDLDDVQDVYSTLEITDETLAAMEAA